MSRYDNQGSPMEFEFQNGTGPLDSRSPFSQISQNAQRFPPHMSTAQKRSYSVFDSPSKPRNLQSSPNKPLPLPPAPAAFNSLFTTPRKPTADIDDSSAGETPRSPEQNNDSDATPDTMNLRAAVSRLNSPSKTAAERSRPASPTKEKPPVVRRESWITKFKSKMNSPGRGEVQSHAIEKRAEKRRRREGGRRKRRHSMTDSEIDDANTRISPRKISGQVPDFQPKQHWISTFFTFLAQHPTVPHVLSFYAQLAFNVFLLGFCAYLLYGFYSAIRGDIDKEAHDAMLDIMAEISMCAKEYTSNECDRPTRLPALEKVCEGWNKCMKQDPKRVARAKMSAQAFAKIFNAFIEPISYKAMAFTCMMIAGAFILSNCAFVFFRNKAVNGNYYEQGPPPPTPHRTFSGQDGGFYGTPWHQPPIGFEPQPSGGYGQIEGRQSPVRRLAYN